MDGHEGFRRERDDTKGGVYENGVSESIYVDS